jgi:syntaxin-binding protein 5
MWQTEQITALKVRPGARKWPAGYQADLVCILGYIDGEPPGNITVMSLNSSYGLWVALGIREMKAGLHKSF